MAETLWDRMRRVSAERDQLRRDLATVTAERDRLEAEVAALCVPGVVERAARAVAEVPPLSAEEAALWEREEAYPGIEAAHAGDVWCSPHDSTHAEQYKTLGDPCKDAS